MAGAFDMLSDPQCVQVAKPEWWSDEGLRALSARVVRAAPNDESANLMRAHVLSGQCVDREAGLFIAWEAGQHGQNATFPVPQLAARPA